MLNKNNKSVIFLIIFFAGFSFLIYEVSWNRYLSFILGTTVTASTIVLTAFMAGFGLGALILSKFANNTSNPGRLLAKLLSSIGLMSLINFFIIQNLIQSLYGTFSSLFTADLVFFSLIFILLLIPAFFMGGIIPLVSRIAVSEKNEIATNLGKIYAFETLGSTLGGLTAGFILLGTIGQKETIFTAVIINLILAAYLFFSKKFNSLIKKPEEKVIKKESENNSEKSRKIAKISTLFIGFAILGMQIIWIRIFRTYFTNTSYTFTLITSFVILGLFIGSRYYKKQGNGIKNNDIAMLKAIILISIFSLIGLILLIKLPEILLFPFGETIDNQYIRLLLVPVIASFLIVLPPAIISGFAFPLACKMNSENTENISKTVGRILMLNTIGSVMGPLAASFLFIPFFGVGKSLLIIAFLLSLSAFYIAYFLKPTNKISTLKIFLTVKIILLLLIIFSVSLIRFVPPSVKKSKKKILTYKETIEGTIVVVNEKEKGVFGKSTFVNNSSVIGSNYDAVKAVKMIGHIPFFAGLKCKNALIIGFGVGVTTSAIASHPEVKHIDCVELIPVLVNSAFNYKEFNSGIYNDKRLNIIPGDGRHYLQATEKKYDLISCDPTHPVLGSGNLYTQEYFKQVYEHLNPAGMVSQYLPLHKLRLEDLLGIIKTFHSVFNNSTVWLGQYHAILLGKKEAGKIDFNYWKKEVTQMPNDDFFYFEPYHIAANIIFDSEKIEEFSNNIKINTDDLSYTEFFSFDCFNKNNIYNNLKYLSENRCNINKVFSNIYDIRKMNRFVKGNKKLTESLYFSLKGDKKNALNSLLKAKSINPEDQEFPFLLKFYFGQK